MDGRTIMEQKRLLMVFTGGEIASRIHLKALELGSAPYTLLDNQNALTKNMTIIEPISVCSENITPPMYKVLFGEIQKAVGKGNNYDAILIAHGSDTLAYTAQLAAILLSGLDVPVVFFGSKLPPSHPNSDALSNLKSAITLVNHVDSGVYVVGKAIDGKTYAHYACYCMSADACSDDYLSYKNMYAGIIKGKTYTPNDAVPAPVAPANATKYLHALTKLMTLPKEDTILTIDASSCVNYANYTVARSDYKFVLQRLHHFGTTNALSAENPFSLLYLNSACQRYDKHIFIAPIDSSRPVTPSTQTLLDAKIKPLFDCPFEAAWAYLMLSTWLGKMIKL